MKRTCKVCGTEYEITQDEVEYLVKVKMIHPFVACKDCAVKEVADLPKGKQDELIMELGSPEGRKSLWDQVFEAHPEVRTAYVMNELDIT